MATIRKEILIDSDTDTAWAAVRDVGAIHTRLAPGFVIDTKLDGDSRIVSFGNGMVLRERLVTIDEAGRRLAYAAVSDRLSHHSASLQIFPMENGRCRAVWLADILPDALAATIDGMMEQGAEAMRRKLSAAAA